MSFIIGLSDIVSEVYVEIGVVFVVDIDVMFGCVVALPVTVAHLSTVFAIVSSALSWNGFVLCNIFVIHCGMWYFLYGDRSDRMGDTLSGAGSGLNGGIGAAAAYCTII